MANDNKDLNKGRLLGAHCSITGGLYNAPEAGGELGANTIQIFTKNANQWKATPLTLGAIDEFKEALSENNIKMAFAHSAYLINLATIDPQVHEQSMESMKIELERAEALDLPYVVVHPGSHKEAGEISGILQIVENLRRLMDEFKSSRTQIVLETTAGMGSSIGHTFDQFAEIFDRLGWPENIGLCVDTAHIFQAGYDISTEAGYKKVMNELDEAVGIDYIRVFHLNDSKGECGSKVDRHENLGKGKIGKKAFELLVNDKRFKNIPMILETPKAEDGDKKNLKLLRSMIK